MRREFPAVVQIGSQCYDAHTNGLLGRAELADGGIEAFRRVSFTVDFVAFQAAGEPTPQSLQSVTAKSPANLAGEYTIDEVVVDPTGILCTLRCIAAPQ